MTRILAAAAALLAATLASVAAAQTAPPSPRVSPPPVVAQPAQVGEALARWSSQLQAWTGPYNALMTRRIDTVLWLADAGEQLNAKLEASDKAGATDWASAWAARARARLADELAAYQALPTAAPTPPLGFEHDVDLRRRLEVLTRLPDRAGTMLIRTGQAGEAHIRLVEAAASGEPADLDRLDLGTYALLVAQFEAENAANQTAVDVGSSPFAQLAAAKIETNLAMIALMELRTEEFDGRGDPPAAAARVKRHAAAIRGSIAEMRAGLTDLRRRLRPEYSAMGPEMSARMERALESLDQGVGVEARMADALDRLAVAVRDGDDDALDTAWEAAETLAAERNQLDRDRLALLAND